MQRQKTKDCCGSRNVLFNSADYSMISNVTKASELHLQPGSLSSACSSSARLGESLQLVVSVISLVSAVTSVVYPLSS